MLFYLVTMKSTPPAACEVEAQAAQPSVDSGEESCRSCLYTGVATCAGLSAYFLHLAFEDQPPSQQKPTDTTIRKNTSKDTNIPRSTNIPKQPTDFFERTIKLLQQQSPPKSNRQFHLAFSAACAVAGMYRLYLN